MTLLVVLALLEGVLRLVCALGLSMPPCADRDLREEWKWVDRHQAKGPSGFSIEAAKYDPELGWISNPDYTVPGVHINALGQRGTKLVPFERTGRKPRLLFLGDSYTFGAQVKDEECFEDVLNTRYMPEAEVINFGVSAYGTDQQVLLYEREGVKYKADIVVLGVFTHDISRNDARFKFYAKPMFELAGEELALAEATIPSPTDLLALYASGQKEIKAHGLYLLECLRQELEQASQRKRDESTLAWRITAKILERFQKRVREEGAKPFLLIIPHSEILEEGENRSVSISRLLVDRAQAIGLPYLDLGPILREKAKTETGPLYDGHWTAKGHAIVAEALFDGLKKTGWF
jgi:hypothetical protein